MGWNGTDRKADVFLVPSINLTPVARQRRNPIPESVQAEPRRKAKLWGKAVDLRQEGSELWGFFRVLGWGNVRCSLCSKTEGIWDECRV